MTIAIAKKSFYMPAGAVTSKQGKALKDRQIVTIGSLFDALYDTILQDPATRRQYNIAQVKDNFTLVAETPKCKWCAMGVPRGSKIGRCGIDQHAVGEAEGAYVIFIEDCKDPVAL